MEKSERLDEKILYKEKLESNWAEILDYTRFYTPAEINNLSLDYFKKDLEYLK